MVELNNAAYPHQAMLLYIIGGPSAPKDLTVYHELANAQLRRFGRDHMYVDKKGVRKSAKGHLLCTVADKPAHCKVLQLL